MKLLLDTHAFLWWITDDPRLPVKARRLIVDAGNEVYVSAASAWEIVVKLRLGRLSLPQRPDRFLPRQLERNGFLPLPIRLEHALRLYELPEHHRDPFDRILIAQALEDGLVLVSGDPQLRQYPPRVVW